MTLSAVPFSFCSPGYFYHYVCSEGTSCNFFSFLVPIVVARAQSTFPVACCFPFLILSVKVLNLLVDPDRLPALVHCPDGRVLTGIMLWCLRKLQCWDKNAAIAEYMRYCGGVPPTREVRLCIFIEFPFFLKSILLHFCFFFGVTRAKYHSGYA